MLYELLIAARTDEKLKATMQHEARAVLGEDVFNGAAIVEGVLPQPDIAGKRISVLERVADRFVVTR